MLLNQLADAAARHRARPLADSVCRLLFLLVTVTRACQQLFALVSGGCWSCLQGLPLLCVSNTMMLYASVCLAASVWLATSTTLPQHPADVACDERK
jgi:hypothetical protein